eukprot:8628882-Alexandrium_andersonii.AAC.1
MTEAVSHRSAERAVRSEGPCDGAGHGSPWPRGARRAGRCRWAARPHAGRTRRPEKRLRRSG